MRTAAAAGVVVVVVVVALSLCEPIGDPRNDTKTLISNGEPYATEDYPYVVSLSITVREQNTFCTGTLISPLFVLTAAHCTVGRRPSDINVFHGGISWENQHRNVVSVHGHGEYNPETFVSDISLLKLQDPFEFVTQYAKLSGHPDEFDDDGELDCEVIGFGWTESEINGVTGYVVDARVKYGPDACRMSRFERTWREFLCSRPSRRMVCPGDSGGPMMCNGYLYGICSHGYNYKRPEDGGEYVCGSPDYQTRHLFLYAYRDWIDLTTGANTAPQPPTPRRTANAVVVVVVVAFYRGLIT